MTGTPSSFGEPSTPWHTPQTTSLPPRGVWASAAFPGVAGKVSAASTPSTPKTVETQLFIMIPRPVRVPEVRDVRKPLQACRPRAPDARQPRLILVNFAPSPAPL